MSKFKEYDVEENAIQLISDTSRETAAEFMKMNQYVDVLIPRGGRGLIKAVVEQSTIPVIETGTGNCHIYVDETADLQMAADIIMNAKTQRVGVCNACESVLVHKDVKDALLPVLAKRLQEKHVEIRADQAAYELIPGAVHATEEDWGKEYLDYILSVKVVSSVEEAIAHINKYNTKHSEAIITNNYEHSQKFLEEVDAAAVYVNASTRFTDGFEFETACQRPDGTAGSDHNKVYYLWKRTSSPVNLIFSERCAILLSDFGLLAVPAANLIRTHPWEDIK